MKSTKAMKVWGKRLGMACMLSGVLVLGACDKSAKDLMMEADSALQQGDLDRAEKALDEAMKKDSKSFQGPIIRAQIYSAKKEYEKAEQEFVKLWNERQLDGDKLSTEQKRIRGLIKDDYYPKLYQEWSESIDAKANPQKYEEVLSKGLKYDKNSPRLNTLLVDFYNARGEELLTQSKKLEAADIFDKVGGLLTTTSIRKEAKSRAAALREEALVDQIAQRFEQDLKPKLVAAELYDAENKMAIFKAEGEINRRGTPEEALAAAAPTIAAQINAAAKLIGGFGDDVKLGDPTKAGSYKIVESEFKRGVYMVKGGLSEAELKEYAKYVIDRDKAAKAEADSKGGKKAEEGAKPTDGGKKEDVKAPEEGAKEAGDKPAEEKKAEEPK